MTDELIRGRLLELTAELPGGPLMVPKGLVIAARRRRRRRRRGVGALVSFLILSTVAYLGGPLTHNDQQGRTLTPAATPSPHLPASWQAVDFYGVRLDVPVAWKIDATRCGTPMENTVVRDNGQATPLCRVGQPPGLTVVHMTHRGLFFGGAYAHLAGTPATVGGMRALIGSGRPAAGTFRGPSVQVVVLLDQAVVVAVEGPDVALARKLLQTLRPGDVDAAGCQRRILGLTPIGDVGLGSRDTFMPTGYDRLTACRYQDNGLQFSSALTPDQASLLVSALDAAPPGREEPDRTTCTTARGSTAGWVIRGSYPNAPTHEVFINDHPCRKRYLTNGGNPSQLTPAITAALPAPGGPGTTRQR